LDAATALESRFLARSRARRQVAFLSFSGDKLACVVFETELQREEEFDWFVVRTDEASLYAVLVQFGYAEKGDLQYARAFRSSPDAPVYFERFAACARDMFEQFISEVARPWERSVEHLNGLLAAGDVDWLLSGSVALAVRGVEVAPRDIDFTVAEMEPTVEALRDLIVEPPIRAYGGWHAEWFGRAWDGMRIEWVAETKPDLDQHEWTSDIGPDAVARAETIEWRGLSFRVPPLDLQLAVSRDRGLHTRVAAIERFASAT
jgi:hypothetical protein